MTSGKFVRRCASCAQLPRRVLAGTEPDRYPTEFVSALTEAGWLAALIPEQYGGWLGPPALGRDVILEEISRSGRQRRPLATHRCT